PRLPVRRTLRSAAAERLAAGEELFLDRSASSDDAASSAVLHRQARRNRRPDDRDGHFPHSGGARRRQHLFASAFAAGANGTQVAKTTVRNRRGAVPDRTLHPYPYFLDCGAAARADRPA